MSRFFTVAVALVCLTMGAFMLPALSQGPEKPKVAAGTKAPKRMLEIAQLLQTPIATKDFREKVKLKEALENLSDIFQGKLPILVDREAFLVGNDPTDNFDIYDEEVSLPPVPKRMPADRALRIMLAQVGRGRGTFVIRKDWVEITTEQASNASVVFYDHWVVATYKQRPLMEVLDDLSELAGVAINIDPSVGDKANMAISATFLNCSFEEAMVTVTEMTKLSYVLLDRSIYITTPEHAKTMERDEAARRKKRSEMKIKIPERV